MTATETRTPINCLVRTEAVPVALTTLGNCRARAPRIAARAARVCLAPRLARLAVERRAARTR